MSEITSVLVLKDEAHRMVPLLERLKHWTPKLVIGVQDSSDNTLDIAREFTDSIVEDRPRGYGDATMPQVIARVQTPWAFRVDGDELPTEDLMGSLGTAVERAIDADKEAVWVRFRSWIEDIEWDAYHGHVRLFKTKLGWPGTLHSRPGTESILQWDVGWIEHRKSLDEHIRGYLGYLNAGRGNAGWDLHNISMMYHACVGTAEVKGWDFVRSFDWWPEVQTIAFKEGLPELAVPEL